MVEYMLSMSEVLGLIPRERRKEGKKKGGREWEQKGKKEDVSQSAKAELPYSKSS